MGVGALACLVRAALSHRMNSDPPLTSLSSSLSWAQCGWGVGAGNGGAQGLVVSAGHTLTLLSPAGSDGSMPSLPVSGPCCWDCTLQNSIYRLLHQAGSTHSSLAPRPCAAWWASLQLWLRGKLRAHGGSGPEGQRSSSDCGGWGGGQVMDLEAGNPCLLLLAPLPHL